MSDSQQFCLRWNNYQSSLTTAFKNLREDEDFVDVTLACDGQSMKAHKVVLSACSPYFKDLLKSTPCQHPVMLLRDVPFADLASLVEFMYYGEVNVNQESLASFLKTAELLRIKGLTEEPAGKKAMELPGTISSQSERTERSERVERGERSERTERPIFPRQQQQPPQQQVPTRPPPPVPVMPVMPPALSVQSTSFSSVSFPSKPSRSTEAEVIPSPKRQKVSSLPASPVSRDETVTSDVPAKSEPEVIHLKSEPVDYGSSLGQESSEPSPAVDEREGEDSGMGVPGVPQVQGIVPAPAFCQEESSMGASQDSESMVVPVDHPGGLGTGQQLLPSAGVDLPNIAGPSAGGLEGSQEGSQQVLGLGLERSERPTKLPKAQCPYCPRLITEPHLRRHITETHFPSGERFHCPKCRSPFSTRSSLGTHIWRYHGGVKKLNAETESTTY